MPAMQPTSCCRCCQRPPAAATRAAAVLAMRAPPAPCCTTGSTCSRGPQASGSQGEAVVEAPCLGGQAWPSTSSLPP
jgi:hypothetical protein